MASRPQRVSDEPATVTVRGQAAVRTEPDEAQLTIRLSAFEESPGSALEDVARRSDALGSLLDDLGVSEDDRSTAGISVQETFERPDHTGRLGHRATAHVVLRLADADVIGRTISRASEELRAGIDGPRWYVSAANPVHLRAAEEAAGDARRRAAAFAAGAGAKLGRLVSLAEPDARSTPQRMSRGSIVLESARRDMPVDAEDQQVWATIDATFELTTPPHRKK